METYHVSRERSRAVLNRSAEPVRRSNPALGVDLRNVEPATAIE
jgi:hypothetical protein